MIVDMGRTYILGGKMHNAEEAGIFPISHDESGVNKKLAT